MKKTQTFAGLALIVAMVFFGIFLKGKAASLALFLITGLILGYILTSSRYGFAGGVKKIFLTGDGSLTKAILLLFAIKQRGLSETTEIMVLLISLSTNNFKNSYFNTKFVFNSKNAKNVVDLEDSIAAILFKFTAITVSFT